MELIRKRAFARAGLVGNPSDGYFGKTISLVVRDFFAEVTLYEWDQVEIVWSQEDQSRFRSVDDLVTDVKLHGYYGGVRLVKATIKKFVEYCKSQKHRLHDRNFSIRYQSNIPRQVGLAGSSAIIVATLRCLMEFFDVAIPRQVQPSLALAVENEELGIAAGLQDRVIQVYEGLVFMDFSRDKAAELDGLPCGAYESLDPRLLPPVYLAYSTDVSEPTEVVHNRLRARWEQADPEVTAAIARFARLADDAREALLAGESERLGTLINANFDLRRSVCPIKRSHQAMIDAARQAGATAKFAGSGGAIVGTYPDQPAFERLAAALERLSCKLVRPVIEPPAG